ncbi:hypothetical protein F385_25 [Pantoea agglomerans 299R]|uniref:DUF1493 family protein n=1 Tax=Pantoea sp. MHSD4 TaxID=2898077 RepID=UPI0002A69DDC|nr:DUF1493 family protein [Pantoea agglomerans]ELP25803.1 hypothetical protein F385_1116 [Pantoea agglomerans 299R]ELP26892.1 hypothetical protein F385_25 [Pantoea agglomerans 299R]MCD2358702.1 DUF1493 family protein [Pantoea sp. MHSD4]PQL26603.1 DUF1493 domain-containing protein [Pantoea ananatis]
MNNMTVTPDAVREFILRELPLVTTFLLKKIEVGDDDILQEQFEADDIAEMAKNFFNDFDVQPAGFNLVAYFPWKSSSLFSRKNVKQDKEPLTIRMFIESARAGRWLF